MTADPATLARLITDNLGLIYLFAMRLSFKHREEIVQEACVGIMRSKTYDPEVSVASFLHWQVRGAFTQLKVRERRYAKARKVAKPEDAVPSDQDSAVELAVLADRARTLPPRQRRAVTLMLADNNYIEIGQAMGISHQAAHALVKRARPALGLAA